MHPFRLPALGLAALVAACAAPGAGTSPPPAAASVAAPAPTAVPAAPRTIRLREVTSASVVQRGRAVIVSASCHHGSAGLQNVRLQRRPADDVPRIGLYAFDCVADAPEMAPPTENDTRAACIWATPPANLVSVRVIGEQNDVIVRRSGRRLVAPAGIPPCAPPPAPRTR
jgi:hypothetical protein